MMLAVMLLILWALGLFVLPASTWLVHVLIVLAVIALVVHLVRGKRLAA